MFKGKSMRLLLLIISIIPVISFSSLCYTGKTVVNSSPAYPAGFYPDDPLPDKTAYLTFDDGPSEWTEKILDILSRERIRATFFISGDWAPHSTEEDNDFRKYKNILIRMIKEGHAIGNHTLDHKDLARLEPSKIAFELDENQALLDRELGKDSMRMTLIRPPFGSPWHDTYGEKEKTKVGNEIRTRGLVVLWSRHFDSGDSMNWVKGDWYREAPRVNIDNAEFKKRMNRIYERIIRRADGKGMVMLFHDTHLTTMEVLPEVIDKLKSEGYKFATIEEFVKWKWGKSSSTIIKSIR